MTYSKVIATAIVHRGATEELLEKGWEPFAVDGGQIFWRLPDEDSEDDLS